MKNADPWSSLGLLLLSGLICWGALLLPYGSVHNPGAGFYPFWLGIILGGMAIALFWQSARRKGGGKTPGDRVAEKVRWGKVLGVALALVLYAALMEFLGFLIATLLFMAFLLRAIEPQPWRTVILWTVSGALGSYLVFEVWMKLRLPKGFLGF